MASDGAFPREHRPQELHRMAFQRQPHGLIIRYHLLGQRHLRQRLCRLVQLFARRGGDEQRQRHIIRQSPHRPQRRTAIQPERTERIGIRQQDQRALRQLRVARELFQRGERPPLPCRDDAVAPVVRLIPSPLVGEG